MVFYPGSEVIRDWGFWVAEQDYLRDYLPALTDNWAAKIEADFQLTQILQQDLAESAARLFYRIIKNHRFIDGNKRSALLATYLLVVYNQHWLDIAPRQLYKLAKGVARSRGDQEIVIELLTEVFQKRLRSAE